MTLQQYSTSYTVREEGSFHCFDWIDLNGTEMMSVASKHRQTNQHSAERVTLLEVAHDAGVSRATASLVLRGNTAETLSKQVRLLAMMQEYRADGVLLCPATGTSTQTIVRLRQWRLPFVLFVRYVEGVDADYVGTDNIRGAELATEHLISLGHQRIAFVGGPANSSARRDRLQGYRNALVRHGLPIDPALQLASPTTREGGHQCIRALLDRAEPPTAVLCYND